MHKTDSDFEFKIQNGCFIFKHYYFDSKKTFWYLLPFYDFKTDLILKAQNSGFFIQALQIKLIRSKTECVRFIHAQGGGGGKSTDFHWTRAFGPFLVRARPPLFSIHV